MNELKSLGPAGTTTCLRTARENRIFTSHHRTTYTQLTFLPHVRLPPSPDRMSFVLLFGGSSDLPKTSRRRRDALSQSIFLPSNGTPFVDSSLFLAFFSSHSPRLVSALSFAFIVEIVSV
jgi:hypothetical protein